MMRFKFSLTIPLAVALFSGICRADFAISAFRTDLDATNSLTTGGNGPITGNFGLIQFYAQNLGAGATTENQGSKLESVSLTMADTGAGKLVIGGYTGSVAPSAGAPADLFGANEFAVSGSSYIFKELNTSTPGAPKYVSAVNMLGSPTVSGDNNPQQTFNVANLNPANQFSSYGYAVQSFSADFGSTTGGVNATTSNGGRGALFAVAVVPIGDSVNVQGSMGGDIGGIATSFNYTSTVLAGDFNLDGVVNSTDLQTVLNNFNHSGVEWTTGDTNGDGICNSTDLQAILNNFNHSSPTIASAAAAAVPEPAAFALIGMGSAGFLARRRRAA